MRRRAQTFAFALLANLALTTAAVGQPAPPVPPPVEPQPAPQPPAAPPAAPPPAAQPAPMQTPGGPPGAWVEPQPQQPPYPQQPAPYPQQPPYGYGPYGQYQPMPYQPPVGPPPPPLPPREPSCCRFGIRFDPFDLLFRRLSFQTEVGIWGPFSVEAETTWIFGSPTENLDTTGGALMGSVLVYISGRYLEGFYAKASVGFESFEAVLTDEPLQKSTTADVSSPIFGISIGSSTVFGGDDFGFNLAGGVGIGFATGEPVTLQAGRYETVFYDKSSSIQLLASLGLGIGF